MLPIKSILSGMIAFLPAMTANSFAVLMGGGTPVDLGKKIGGKRIMGDGKTWRGLFGGGFSGALVGLVFIYLVDPFLGLYPHSCGGIFVIFALSFGALFGDMGASVLKRRAEKGRGESFPLIDQYDFVVGAMIFAYVLDPDWLLANYIIGDGLLVLLILLVLIPLLHKGINLIGYELGYKKEPW